MIFSLKQLKNSVAGVLKQHWPDRKVYGNPNQQGTKIPCFFVFYMPSKLKNQVGDTYVREIGIDIVYVNEKNRINAYEDFEDIADQLDEALELFEYKHGTKSTLIRSYEREWTADGEEMHYQFTVKVRVSHKKKVPFVEEIQSLRGGVK